MGSLIPEEKLPPEMLKLFVDVFSRIPQRIIWKCKTRLPGLPDNVKLVEWAPQQDLLGHKDIRAFITQGGTHSLQEAVYHGVPVIGIPVIGDQHGNIQNAMDKGFCIGLQFEHLTSESLNNAIQRIMTEPSFRTNVKALSLLMRDQPMPLVDKAVYWIEYVIRYDGGRHLHPDIDHLNFLQYFLLDIVGMIILFVAIAVYIIYICIKRFRKWIQQRKVKIN